MAQQFNTFYQRLFTFLNQNNYSIFFPKVQFVNYIKVNCSIRYTISVCPSSITLIIVDNIIMQLKHVYLFHALYRPVFHIVSKAVDAASTSCMDFRVLSNAGSYCCKYAISESNCPFKSPMLFPLSIV